MNKKTALLVIVVAFCFALSFAAETDKGGVVGDPAKKYAHAKKDEAKDDLVKNKYEQEADRGKDIKGGMEDYQKDDQKDYQKGDKKGYDIDQIKRGGMIRGEKKRGDDRLGYIYMKSGPRSFYREIYRPYQFGIDGTGYKYNFNFDYNYGGRGQLNYPRYGYKQNYYKEPRIKHRGYGKEEIKRRGYGKEAYKQRRYGKEEKKAQAY